jgi:hypothetical protein
MAIQNKLIVRRFLEGLSVADLCKRYTLAEWEVEDALRKTLVDRVQKKLDFDDPVLDHPADPRQITIEEQVGTITV